MKWVDWLIILYYVFLTLIWRVFSEVSSCIWLVYITHAFREYRLSDKKPIALIAVMSTIGGSCDSRGVRNFRGL